MRQRVLRDHEGAARVDLVHQIEALHLGLRRRRSRLIAEALLTTMSMPPNVSAVRAIASCDGGLVADVDGERQRLAAGRLDLLGGGVDRAFELRMRLGRLRGDGDVGAVARGAERDGEPDAARGAGDEERLAGEAHAVMPPTASAASAPSTSLGALDDRRSQAPRSPAASCSAKKRARGDAARRLRRRLADRRERAPCAR